MLVIGGIKMLDDGAYGIYSGFFVVFLATCPCLEDILGAGGTFGGGGIGVICRIYGESRHLGISAQKLIHIGAAHYAESLVCGVEGKCGLRLIVRELCALFLCRRLCGRFSAVRLDTHALRLGCPADIFGRSIDILIRRAGVQLRLIHKALARGYHDKCGYICICVTLCLFIYAAPLIGV